MVTTATLLTYIMTHAFDHPDRMQLSVKHKEQAVVLQWKAVPPKAHSLAVVIQDSAKKHPHYYGVIYNLPTDSHGIKLDHHVHVASNHWGKNSWGQVQVHDKLLHGKHLVVSLYAVDKRFSAKYQMTGQALSQHLKGHVIAQSKQLIG